MISPEELKKKLLKSYLKILRQEFSDNQVFPYSPKINLSVDLSGFNTAVQSIRKLEAASGKHGSENADKEGKNGNKPGYRIIYKTIKTRKFGIQSTPERLVFDKPEDLYGFIGKEQERKDLLENIAYTGDVLSLGEDWFVQNLALALRYLETWRRIVDVVHQLLSMDATIDLDDVQIRSLAVSEDTKFIETYQTAIRNLLSSAREKEISPEPEKALLQSPLKESDTYINCRFLYGNPGFFGASIGAFPLSEMTNMRIPVEQVLIIENKTSFLSPLPDLKSYEPAFCDSKPTLLIWGEGNAASRLSQLHWINEIPGQFYWGDMDLHGLAILGRLREYFPQLVSVAMDMISYRCNTGFVVPGKMLARGTWYERLTAEEKELTDYLIDHPEVSRIEQERVK